jgi:alpha-ketoglutarate-dependent taurine dioxygenase
MRSEGQGEVRWQPLPDAPFGVEIEPDLELGEPVGPLVAAQLRRLLGEHDLLVVRGGLTAQEQLRLCAAFGRVLPQGPRAEVGRVPSLKQPEILWLENEGGALGNDPLDFHIEFAYLSTPLTAVSLCAEAIGDDQAGTRFVSGRLAWQRLPTGLQDRLDQLQGLFVAQYDAARRAALARHRDLEVDPRYPRAVHPLVVRHPVTGVPALYVTKSQTDRVLGLAPEESDALLAELHEHLYADPSIGHEHRYEPGDCIVWDNLNLQHARRACDPAVPRRLRRVVTGERAPWEEWPAAPALVAPRVTS